MSNHQPSIHLAKLIKEASSPETTSARLTQLAQEKHAEITKAIASNPNTPPEILWQLGQDYPSELLNNPVLALLPLENLNFIQDIPEHTIVALLREKECPEWLIELALKQRPIVIIKNHGDHKDIWNQLRDKYPEIEINLQYANLQYSNLPLAN